jgi:hypothetical protein
LNRSQSRYCKLLIRYKQLRTVRANKDDRKAQVRRFGVFCFGASALAQDPLHGTLSSIGIRPSREGTAMFRSAHHSAQEQRERRKTYHMPSTCDVGTRVRGGQRGTSFVVPTSMASGLVVKLHGSVVHWRSCKQPSVTKSTRFAECYAASSAADECVYFANLLTKQGYGLGPTPLICVKESTCALRIVRNPVVDDRSK